MTNLNNKKRHHHRPHTYVYAVDGLTEWVALINVGKAKVRIPFTGGSMSAYGCVPARFGTYSQALAMLIEKSDHFINGKIKRCF